MNLILVRHGETDWNREGRCQGFSDVELNDNGKRQIRELSRSLRNEKISAIYSSDLKRAKDTAIAIAEYHNISVDVDPRLREMDQGDFEGILFAEIRERYGYFLGEWKENPESVRPPGGGESLKEVQERAWEAIKGIYKKHDGETVVTVSHNLTIITLLCKFTGAGLREFPNIKVQAASRNLILFRNGEVSVETVNDVSHLSLGMPMQ